MSLLCALLAASCLLVALPVRAETQPQVAPRRILVVYSNGRLLAANVAADRGLRASLDGFADPIEIYDEFLDLPRFEGAAYEDAFKAYLRQKYAERRPEIAIAGGGEALRFLLRTRDEIFPGVPLVHLGVGVDTVTALSPLPEDARGLPLAYDATGTIEQALRWLPEARRVVVVLGAGAADRAYESSLRGELARIEARATVEYWSGLPLDALAARLSALGPDTIVFSAGFFEDGTGQHFTPRASVERLARASVAPVFGPYDTFLGAGIVGGRVPSFEEAGREGGEIAKALLAGASPASLDLPAVAPMRVEIDWRQAQRFGIREANIAPDTVVLWREPSFWEAYRAMVLGGGAVIALQGGLIVALLFERRRRQTAQRLIDLATDAAGLSTWVWDAPRAGRDPFAGAHPADRPALERAVRDALDEDVPVNVEYRIVGSGGTGRWFAAYGRRERGPAPRVLGVARDITDRKAAELQTEHDQRALRRVSRVAMLGQLSASIAHELNQPLTAILANAETARSLLQREPLQAAELKELRAICDDIVSDDHRAADVILRLRALFKRGELRLARLDVNELVRESLELARTDLAMRHVDVLADLALDLPAVSGDRVQLQQVILNLIVNGADAMGALAEHDRELAIRTERGPNGVRIAVADRGPGVAPENLERIFEPFWSTKSSGMGMGLAICRWILDAHGGRVRAANRAGTGAEFEVFLPAGAPA